eukprot:scaffold9536_cov20-Tisochrysis_lutea.AAC.2
MVGIPLGKRKEEAAELGWLESGQLRGAAGCEGNRGLKRVDSSNSSSGRCCKSGGDAGTQYNRFAGKSCHPASACLTRGVDTQGTSSCSSSSNSSRTPYKCRCYRKEGKGKLTCTAPRSQPAAGWVYAPCAANPSTDWTAIAGRAAAPQDHFLLCWAAAAPAAAAAPPACSLGAAAPAAVAHAVAKYAGHPAGAAQRTPLPMQPSVSSSCPALRQTRPRWQQACATTHTDACLRPCSRPGQVGSKPAQPHMQMCTHRYASTHAPHMETKTAVQRTRPDLERIQHCCGHVQPRLRWCEHATHVPNTVPSVQRRGIKEEAYECCEPLLVAIRGSSTKCCVPSAKKMHEKAASLYLQRYVEAVPYTVYFVRRRGIKCCEPLFAAIHGSTTKHSVVGAKKRHKKVQALIGGRLAEACRSQAAL